MEYTIAAIPTVYRGRQYRSRLEAKWAAFFDLVGWQHEYEPFDLGEWSPDFLLPELNALIEVKPITELDDELFARMRRASQAKLVAEEDEEPMGPAIVLLGVAPVKQVGRCQLGWWGSGAINCRAEPAFLGWIVHPHRPEFSVDIVSVFSEGWYSAGGAAGWDGEGHPFPHHYPHHTMDLWARASNAVQWRGTQSEP